jgi:hypothetical protein
VKICECNSCCSFIFLCCFLSFFFSYRYLSCLLCSFRFFLYDCLKKTGFSNTAECFRNEAQITRQYPPGMYIYMHIYCCESWYCDKMQKQLRFQCNWKQRPLFPILYIVLIHGSWLFYVTVFSDFDEHRHPQGLLYKLWSLFYDKYKSRQQKPGSSSQSQVIIAKINVYCVNSWFLVS